MQPHSRPEAAVPFDVENVLASLTTKEKVALLGGQDFWHTCAIPAKNIPSIRLSDGPNGVRGTSFSNGPPSNCYPCATGVAASFDTELSYRLGVALGLDCKAKGTHALLGPTTNTQRSPLGGRGFESFSEDPVLNGRIAAGYIQGVQSEGVAATLKHFVANDQEYERFSSDSIVSERALREIYLEPFRIATSLAAPKAYMTGYNKVNGAFCSESQDLLINILRNEWKYQGVVMSDWTGCHSVEQSIHAGLDLEMPGPPLFRGEQAMRALQSGKLKMKFVDGSVRRVLTLVKSAIESEIPFRAKESFRDTEESRSFLREIAGDSIVLLKNNKNLLPFKEGVKRIAVIGSNARTAAISGGGSASLQSPFVVTPLEAITKAAEKIGASVRFALGPATYKHLPAFPSLCSHPNGTANVVAKIDMWLEEPDSNFKGSEGPLQIAEPEFSCNSSNTTAILLDDIPGKFIMGKPFIRYTSIFKPDIDGDWEFAISSSGHSKLFINDRLIVDNVNSWQPSAAMFGLGSAERRGTIRGLVKGETYRLEVRMWRRDNAGPTVIPIAGVMKLGAFPKLDDEVAIQEAADLASSSDVVVVVTGLNSDCETEGVDRADITLPGRSDDLVEAVLQANPSSIIVNQSGSAVSMPWVDRASTILQAFYGGSALGHGMADVLFGNVNPSARLPVTFMKRIQDSPSFIGFGSSSENSGKALYHEGIYVGYRYFHNANVELLFSFGHGLSYTTFSYSDLQVTDIDADGNFIVSFSLQNIGQVLGKEVSQVYVSDKESRLPRPALELKGFKKTSLEPGQEKRVLVELSRDALKYWDDREEMWVAEAGMFGIHVGGTLERLELETEVNLASDLKWKGLN